MRSHMNTARLCLIDVKLCDCPHEWYTCNPIYDDLNKKSFL